MIFLNDGFAVRREFLSRLILKIGFFITFFSLLTLAKCTPDFHDCIFLSLKCILSVFKCIHFTVVILLLTLKKEIEIKTDNATESPFMY